MKVCVLGPITTKSYYGGVAVFDEQLALGFYRLGHSVCIVTYQSDASGDDLFGCIPINVIHSKRKCSKWLEQEKPDLIIGSLDYPKLLDRKATSNGKVAYFLHGFFTRSYYGAIKSQLAPLYQKYLIRNADYVFANSDFTRMINREFFGINADEVFRLGVSEDFFDEIKNISTTEKEKGTILYAGRLVSAKGVDRLIEAVKIMGENGVDYKLLIAGEGPDKEVLEKYSKEKKLKVEFLGMVNHEQISKLYRKAEVFVSLNPSEPFGITFAEALLSECKIVCPTTGGQVEYLQGLDESVSFVNGESVADIAYGIEKLLSQGKYPGLSTSEKESFTYKDVAQRICEFCEK